MKKRLKLGLLALAAIGAVQGYAQDITFKGVYENNRWTDVGDEHSKLYLGSLKYVDDEGNPIETDYKGYSTIMSGDYPGFLTDPNGNVVFINLQDGGIYSMTWDGNTLTEPKNDPEIPTDFYKSVSWESYKHVTDVEKAVWVKELNGMKGNSGGVYANGKIYLVNSRDEQSTVDEELFSVTSWDAETGECLSSKIYPKSACLESAGMAYNPVDGIVYGLFYLTEQDLPDEIKNDPEFFTDEEGDASSEDAGYALCAINLETMKIKVITPGLYYGNFVTFAINEEGRAFSLTSGGTSSTATDENGRLIDINGNITGAQLEEWDLATGLKITKKETFVDSETGEQYTADVTTIPNATGYCSQFRRQSACFAKSNPNKMYWNGFFNSGKGINDWGSWGTLPDKEWRTNGKFDTSLYEVDVTTGLATRLSNVPERFRFSVLWVDKDNSSDNRPIVPPVDAIENISAKAEGNVQVYNTSGMKVYNGESSKMNLKPGMYIIKDGNYTQKVLVK